MINFESYKDLVEKANLESTSMFGEDNTIITVLGDTYTYRGEPYFGYTIVEIYNTKTNETRLVKYCWKTNNPYMPNEKRVIYDAYEVEIMIRQVMEFRRKK